MTTSEDTIRKAAEEITRALLDHDLELTPAIEVASDLTVRLFAEDLLRQEMTEELSAHGFTRRFVTEWEEVPDGE